MLLVGALESFTFLDLGIPPLRLNPARGVDLPDLGLGVKSPSENYCTSEPFFSAYERLIGSEHDALILLTDYQQKKDDPPLRLQLIKWRYLTKTQIADEGLCNIARTHREKLLGMGDAEAMKVFRFLSYVNQSSWLGKKLVNLVSLMNDPDQIRAHIKVAEKDFHKKNTQNAAKDKELIPDADLEALQGILNVDPLHLGIINAADNWTIETFTDLARMPIGNEWTRLCEGPLDGAIGMSAALQWRYNFGRIFGVNEVVAEEVAEPCLPLEEGEL
jgi:hypothetical protein